LPHEKGLAVRGFSVLFAKEEQVIYAGKEPHKEALLKQSDSQPGLTIV
jgi:hypothetical protein